MVCKCLLELIILVFGDIFPPVEACNRWYRRWLSMLARITSRVDPPVVHLTSVKLEGGSKQPSTTKKEVRNGTPKRRLPTLTQLSSTLRSPIGALLLVCTFTLLYCAAEMISPPPFGVNTRWTGGAECAGPEFELKSICICPRETVCIKDVKSLLFLAFSRLSAYFDYPLYVILFLSKAHNLRGILQRTHLSEFLPLDDMHNLHTFAGTVVGFEVIWHSWWHLLRWGLDGDIKLLWQHQTGTTGFISLIVTPLIAWPMLIPRLRKGIEFRTRKALHYLSMVWGVSICFHAPARWIGLIMGLSVGLYVLDWLYGYFFKISYVQTLKFKRIGSSVQVTWEHPPGFKSEGSGYVYLCLPWISRTEWHAFSLVSHPTLPNHSCVCMAAVGDWTKAVHNALSKPCSRPGWLYGPFPSPFSTAAGYDNLIGVASGIGITPSMSVIVNMAETRVVHLIWMCRDADLIEFYMTQFEKFHKDAWSFIFYTGKRSLVLGDKPKNPRVKVCLGRPNLEELIVALVDHTHHGSPMPKKLLQKAAEAEDKIYNKSPTARFADALERAMVSYSLAEMFAMALDATEPMDGKPPESASLDGFLSMVHTVCSIEGGVTDEDLTSNFKAVDTSGNGTLEEDELAQIFETLRLEMAAEQALIEASKALDTYPSRCGSGAGRQVTSEATLRRQASSLMDASREERKHMTDNWQIMYCGGAAPVVKTLEEIKQKYDIPLKIESFAW